MTDGDDRPPAARRLRGSIVSSGTVTDPGVVERVDLGARAPDPAECLPPGEEPLSTVELSSGWIAVTEREVVCYHPDREPPLARTSRHNVTGLVLRRDGARNLLEYVPRAVVGALLAVAGGGLMRSVDPADSFDPPDAEAVDGVLSVVEVLVRGMDVLGGVLVFVGILVGLATAAVVGYWFVSRQVLLVVERGGGDPIECPTTRASGRRALRELEGTLTRGVGGRRLDANTGDVGDDPRPELGDGGRRETD